MAESPLINLGNLPGKVSTNGSLMCRATVMVGSTGPAQNAWNLRGVVDENNQLVVVVSGFHT